MARFEFNSEDAAMGGTINAEVLFQMGILASTGRNGDLDNVAAHKWFNLAALKGKSEAAEYRQELAAAMSKDELSDALQAAREWMKLH